MSAQDIYAFVLIGIGLIGGLLAPFMTQTRVKSTAVHVAGWILWFLFSFVASQLITVLFMMLLGQKMSTQVEFQSIFQVLTYLVTLIIMVSLPWRRWKNQQIQIQKNKKKKSAAKVDTRQFIRKLSGLDRKPTWDDVKKFLLCFPLYFVTNLIVGAVMTVLVGVEIMSQEQNVGFAKTGYGPSSLLLIFFCLVIVAPLFEEMLVRGALFSKLREKLKFWPAALFTASVFALIHGQFNVGVMTFILALFCAYLREKTGAIWSGIMLHMTQNMIAFSLLYLVK